MKAKGLQASTPPSRFTNLRWWLCDLFLALVAHWPMVAVSAADGQSLIVGLRKAGLSSVCTVTAPAKKKMHMTDVAMAIAVVHEV